MSRPRGGYIGFNRVPAASAFNSAASGIWTLREAEALKRAGTWPFPFSSPTQISGLQLWLDASDDQTLFDATTGGSLVAADGGVARWEDKSGNARHATQGTAGARPLRKASVQNSLDALRFDGSNDVLSVPSSTATFKFLHSADSTSFLVAKAGTTADPQAIYAFFATGSITGGQPNYVASFDDRSPPNEKFLLVIGSNNANTGDGFNARVIDPTFSANEYQMASVIAKPTAAATADRISARVNGGASSPATSSGRAASTNDAMGDLTIGSTTAGTSFFLNGDICEIIIYNSALSDTLREAVEDYLIDKWGIT